MGLDSLFSVFFPLPSFVSWKPPDALNIHGDIIFLYSPILYFYTSGHGNIYFLGR